MEDGEQKQKKYLSLRAYSRHRGVTLHAVQKAIKTKRINCEIINGKKKIDQQEADKLWGQNTDQSKISHANIIQKEDPEFLDPEIKNEIELDPELEAEYCQAAAEEEFDEKKFPISKSIRIERWYKAQSEKMKYEKQRGLLIEVEKIEAQFFKLARITRDAMLNIPNRVSGEVAAEKDPHQVHKILTQAINEALEQLTNKRPTD